MLIRDDGAKSKRGRTANKPYVVLGLIGIEEKFMFANDFKEFDVIDQHFCLFGGFIGDDNCKPEEVAVKAAPVAPVAPNVPKTINRRTNS